MESGTNSLKTHHRYNRIPDGKNKDGAETAGHTHRHVDAVARECPSIPDGCIQQIEIDAFARTPFCHCKAARFL